MAFVTPAKEGRKEGNVLFNDTLSTFYLPLYGVRHMVIRTILIVRKETRCRNIGEGLLSERKEGNVLVNDALNTFYLRLYGVRHMVKDHSDSERKPTAATWATLSN